MHIHISMQNNRGENVFADASGEDSTLLKRALAGRGAWITGHNLLKSPPIRVDRFGLYSSVLTGDGSVYTLEREYLL